MAALDLAPMLVYRLSQTDLLHAARAWEGHHWRTGRYVVATLIALSGCVYLALGSLWWGAGFLTVGALEAANLLPTSVFKTFVQFRTNPKFRDEFRLTPTEDSLRFQNSAVDATLQWTIYSAWIETPRVFVLTGRQVFTVIPQRAFADDAARTAFRRLLGRVVQS